MMVEYIEREKLLTHLEETKEGLKTPAWEWLIDALLECYKKFPAAYTVEVVRCKDCFGKASWYKDVNGCDICGVSGLFIVEDNDFCSYGERKENEH